MRAEKKQTKQPLPTDAEFLKQYESSTAQTKQLIDERLSQFSAACEELGRLVKIRSSSERSEQAGRMRELDRECGSHKAHILWYINVVDTYVKSIVAITEKKSLKKAMKLRTQQGKYRAAVLERTETLIKDYEKSSKLVPSGMSIKDAKEEN